MAAPAKPKPNPDAPRHVIAAAIKPMLPTRWKIIPYQRDPGVQLDTFVMFKQSDITRHPQMPQGAHLIVFTVTIVSPYQDETVAEDDLDATVPVLLHALDEARIAWTECTKTMFGDRLSYDITLSVSSTPKLGT